jgi:hypothetical protein
MAVTTLSQAIHDWWVLKRPGVNTDPAATLRTGLVSDLQVGDFLMGARANIVAIGASGAATATRNITLQRRGELTFSVDWVNGATVWFTRV